MIGQRFYPVFTMAKSLSSKAKRDSSGVCCKKVPVNTRERVGKVSEPLAPPDLLKPLVICARVA
jgi:hypothetical protein